MYDKIDNIAPSRSSLPTDLWWPTDPNKEVERLQFQGTIYPSIVESVGNLVENGWHAAQIPWRITRSSWRLVGRVHNYLFRSNSTPTPLPQIESSSEAAPLSDRVHQHEPLPSNNELEARETQNSISQPMVEEPSIPRELTTPPPSPIVAQISQGEEEVRIDSRETREEEPEPVEEESTIPQEPITSFSSQKAEDLPDDGEDVHSDTWQFLRQAQDMAKKMVKNQTVQAITLLGLFALGMVILNDRKERTIFDIDEPPSGAPINRQAARNYEVYQAAPMA